MFPHSAVYKINFLGGGGGGGGGLLGVRLLLILSDINLRSHWEPNKFTVT